MISKSWLGFPIGGIMDYTMFERVGIPLGCLIALGFAVWRTLIWLGAKVVEPIANSHVELVESTKKTNELNAETLAKVGELLEKKSVAIEGIAGQNSTMIALTQETNRILKGQQK
jgi:hypothetical protein